MEPLLWDAITFAGGGLINLAQGLLGRIYLGRSRRKFKVAKYLAKRIFKFLVAGKSVNQTPGLLLIFFHYPFYDGFADIFVAFFVKG